MTRFDSSRALIWGALLFVGVCSSAALPSDSGAADPVTIPFETSPRGHILVSATVDGGEPLRLIVDTAAGSCVLEPDAIERLDIAVTGTEETVRGELGDSRQMMFRLDGLTVGDRTRDGLETASQDLSHFTRGRFEIDGILGANFLREFDVRIDFENGQMTLFDRAESLSSCAVCPQGASPVAFEQHEQGHILLPAAIGDTPMTGLLDSGSGHSGINTVATKALGLELPESAATSGPHGHGVGIQGGPVLAGEVLLQDRAQLMVVDRADIFETFGLADKPRVLMGTDLFRGRVLSISYGTKTLYVQ